MPMTRWARPVSKNIYFLFIFSVLFLTGVVSAAGLKVQYPEAEKGADARSLLAKTMVELALKNQNQEWQFAFFPTEMERQRMEHELESGRTINVLLLPGTDDYDQRYLIVPIPVDRGLLGMRISFVSSQKVNRLQEVQTLADLQQHKICTGKKWNITKAFVHNKIPVMTSNEYRRNFTNLVRGGCLHFSRGLSEIEQEFNNFSGDYQDLAVDPYVLLSLPLAYYLYVSPAHPELHKAISEGLQNAVDNGQFFEVFDELFATQIERLGLENRRTIPLAPQKAHSGGASPSDSVWFQF